MVTEIPLPTPDDLAREPASDYRTFCDNVSMTWDGDVTKLLDLIGSYIRLYVAAEAANAEECAANAN